MLTLRTKALGLAFSALFVGLGTSMAGGRGGRVEVLASSEPAMVPIPAGAFVMGMPMEGKEVEAVLSICMEDFRSSADDICHINQLWAPAQPARDVHVGAFLIDRHEVTVSEFRRCVRAGKCDVGALLFGDQRYNKGPWPIVNVSWNDANDYCDWQGKRLPSEAEWEKAARGSKSYRWPWGPVWRTGSANHGQLAPDVVLALKSVRSMQTQGRPTLEAYQADDSDGFKVLAPPGSMIWGDSPYGVADLAGNVSEWVADFYSEEGNKDLPLINPLRNTPHKADKRRTVRGGSWLDPRVFTLSYLRFGRAESLRSRDVGFRCAR